MSPRTLPLPVVIATVAVFATIAVGSIIGLPIALMAAAGLALVLVIALIWSSLQHLSGEVELTLEEALSLAAPTVEEEQKRAVLRTLKDLEYERSVGKISEEDYEQLSRRYREEAKRLIVAVDDTLEPMRKRAAQRLAKFEASLPEDQRVAASTAGSGSPPGARAGEKEADEKEDEDEPSGAHPGSAGGTNDSQRPTLVGDPADEANEPSDANDSDDEERISQRPTVVGEVPDEAPPEAAERDGQAAEKDTNQESSS